MGTFELKICTDTAAFVDTEHGCGHAFEVARILRDLADFLESGGSSNVQLRDINGNRVGNSFYFEKE